MAIYDISRDGVDSLLKLSKDMGSIVADIVNEGNTLRNEISTLSDGLGEFSESIQEIINKNNTALKRKLESIKYLQESLKKLASDIEEILPFSESIKVSNYTHPNVGHGMASTGSDPNAGQRVRGLGGNDRDYGIMAGIFLSGLTKDITSDNSEVKVVNPILSNNMSGKNYSLSHTKQTWHPDSQGNAVFNSPVETGNGLDFKQGKYSHNNRQFCGTCGIVSCLNVLRLAGMHDLKETDIVPFAIKNGFCDYTSSDSGSRGGTDVFDRRNILANYGVNSTVEECNISSIARRVSEGRGVIISVHAKQLWENKNIPSPHAITVTSVKKNSNGEVLGFYVCDSGAHKSGSTYYSAKQISDALTGNKMNVTSIIR